jgi:hypothetical protein
MVKKVHERKIKVNTHTEDTRIKKIEARRGDEIEFVAEDGSIWVIIPDRELKLESRPEGAPYYETDVWFAFQLDNEQSATILVPEDLAPYVSDPVNAPGVHGTKEIYYLVICGSGPDAYPATGNSPPRMIIPPI